MHGRARPGRRRGLLLAAVTVVVAGLAGSSLAGAGGGTFPDVPPDFQFYDEIEAIADAGITTGYGDGTYRPHETVSRAAMAAFMGRGFGRGGVGLSTQNDPAANGTEVNGAAMNVTSGAASGSGGYVMVTATAQLVAVANECPCQITLLIRDTTSSVESTSRSGVVDVPAPGSLGAPVSVTTQGRFAIPANETHQYRAVYLVRTSPGTGTTRVVETHIQGTYVPFDGTGNAP